MSIIIEKIKQIKKNIMSKEDKKGAGGRGGRKKRATS